MHRRDVVLTSRTRGLSEGVVTPRLQRSAVALIVWALVSALFGAPCLGAIAMGGNAPASHTQARAAVERVQQLFLEISAAEKIDPGNLSRLGPYAPIVQTVAKRLKVFRAQSMLLTRRITDTRLDRVLSIKTLSSSSAIRAAKARVEALFQDLDQYRSAVEVLFVQTPKDIIHSNVSQAFKARFLTGFMSTTNLTHKISLGQTKTMRKLAEHYVNLLTFFEAIEGGYSVQRGHILFKDPNDLQVFRRDMSLIRADYVAMNYFHRQRLVIIQNAMTELKKADANR